MPAGQVNIGVTDTHVLQVAPMMLVRGEEPPDPAFAVFPARGHVVVRRARPDAARGGVHDHAPFTVGLDGHKIVLAHFLRPRRFADGKRTNDLKGAVGTRAGWRRRDTGG